MAADEKGKFSAQISQDAVDAALAAVERATSHAPPEPVEGERPSPAVETEVLQREVEQLRTQLEFSQAKARETLEKLKEEHDRALRAAADLDNQKKRAHREKEEAIKFGLEKFLKELLPVADNLDRALAHAATSDKDSLLQGVKMTAKLLEDILGRNGVKPFSAAGQPFDPRFHEAMQQVERDGPSNMVADELLRGYMLNERLIRPALVSVSCARATPAAVPAEPANDPASENDGETSGETDGETRNGSPK